MNNTVVRYGGYGDFNDPDYSDIYSSGGTLALSSSQVASSTEYGLYVTGNASTTVTASTFSTVGNSTWGAGYGIFAYSAGDRS